MSGEERASGVVGARDERRPGSERVDERGQLDMNGEPRVRQPQGDQGAPPRNERVEERDRLDQNRSGTASVTLLAAVGENGVIGRDGGLPWHLPGDLPHVKRTTFGHVVVMGRRTYDSIGKPLPGRTTIVVTRDPDWAAAGVTACGDIESALRVAAEFDPEVYVLGGAEIYQLAMPHADRLLISEVPHSPDGDTFFPPIDHVMWDETSRDPREGFDVVTYQRRR